MPETPCLNTEPPPVRCYMGHRCRWIGNGWIDSWAASHKGQRGPWRWLRVMLGV